MPGTSLQASQGQPPEKREQFGQTTASERAGQPIELAAASVFFAFADTRVVSGEALSVNGGVPTA